MNHGQTATSAADARNAHHLLTSFFRGARRGGFAIARTEQLVELHPGPHFVEERHRLPAEQEFFQEASPGLPAGVPLQRRPIVGRARGHPGLPRRAWSPVRRSPAPGPAPIETFALLASTTIPQSHQGQTGWVRAAGPRGFRSSAPAGPRRGGRGGGRPGRPTIGGVTAPACAVSRRSSTASRPWAPMAHSGSKNVSPHPVRRLQDLLGENLYPTNAVLTGGTPNNTSKAACPTPSRAFPRS